MKHTAFSYVKLTLASMLVLLAGCACAWRLMKIQIVESDTYTAKRISTQKYTQTISATRGEIVDSSGKAIIENKVGGHLSRGQRQGQSGTALADQYFRRKQRGVEHFPADFRYPAVHIHRR